MNNLKTKVKNALEESHAQKKNLNVHGSLFGGATAEPTVSIGGGWVSGMKSSKRKGKY